MCLVLDPAPGERKTSRSRGVSQTVDKHLNSFDSRNIFCAETESKNFSKIKKSSVTVSIGYSGREGKGRTGEAWRGGRGPRATYVFVMSPQHIWVIKENITVL